MRHIPTILIYSRLILGLIILFFSYLSVENYEVIAILLLTIGVLTDIFDGIIARQLNVSTQKMRRLDSTIDQFFFICVVAATYLQCPNFFENEKIFMFVLIGFELLTYLISFLKFRKEVATHTLSAKIWTLILFATLIEIILKCESNTLFLICFWIGILTRLEIIVIILILKNWTNDVPTFYHALDLRKGKNIKRNKFFNG